MIKTKLDTNLAVVQIMWLFLIMRITMVNQNIWMMLELVGCMLCTVYIVANIKYIKKSVLLLVALFACSYMISSLVNRPYNGPYITYVGIIFAWKVIIYFIVPWISIKKRGSKKVVQASWNCLMLYWIPTVITVLIQGRNVLDNANNTYFIGNKFNVTYLNVIMLSLYLYLTREKLEQHSSRMILKLNRNKVGVSIFYGIIIYLAFFMKAYTGLFMILFILILAFLSRVLQFKFNNRWNGFFNFISKPIVMVISTVLSGIVTIMLEAIISLPTVASYLKFIGKTGNIVSRTLIYKNLMDIIFQKPWIGYGYSSAIVSKYFGPNAQNGLAQLIIYIGIVGTVVMLGMVFYCGKCGRKNSTLSAPLLFSIYAFILSATVEITYGTYFFVLLAFYCACGLEKVEERQKVNE